MNWIKNVADMVSAEIKSQKELDRKIEIQKEAKRRLKNIKNGDKNAS